jgi:hypothetical protein
MFSIEFEPFSLGEIGGIKDPIPPMGVIIAAGTYKNHHQTRVQGFEGSRVQGFLL